MKKRLITVLAALAAVAAISVTGGAAQASAASCSTFASTGPSLNSGVDMGWLSNCNVQIDVQIIPQYESGGTWHRATKSGSPAGITMGPYSAGSHADHHLFQGLDQTPYCSFNWRGSYDAFDLAGNVLASIIGQELHKTC